ncbi:MAG: ABC transporter permease [Planctomycetes bacterium]|nr:ABC transporter permease [Planctomycetota bacterium]
MNGALVLHAARPVRLLFALVAFAPWWCNSRPVLELAGGRLGSPATAGCGAVDWCFAAIGFAELLWQARRSRIACGAVVLLGLLLMVGAFSGEGATSGSPGGERLEPSLSFTIPAPIPWSPGVVDPVWFMDPTARAPMPPSPRHWLGTDPAGYDLLARLLFALRGSLAIAVAAAAVMLTIGVAIGGVCGTLRGRFDLLAMRGIEVLLCFPHFFLVLFVLTYLPRSGTTLVMILGLTGWTGVARLVRGEFFRLAQEEFVLAAEALGASRWQIAWRHQLRNAMAPVFAAAPFAIAGALLTEFTLSWLGLGVARGAASLGTMLEEGHRAVKDSGPVRLTIVPTLTLVVVVLAFHHLAERLRRANTPDGEAIEPESLR